MRCSVWSVRHPRCPHHPLSDTNHTCSQRPIPGLCLDVQPRVLFGAFPTLQVLSPPLHSVVKCATHKSNTRSTRHAYLTHLLRRGPAWNTTWNAIDGRRFGILGRTGECLPCRLACTPLFLSRPPEPCYQNTWEPRTESRRPKYEREIYRTALIRTGTSTPLTRHMPELGTHTTIPRPSVF